MTAFDPTPLRPDAPAMPQLFISSPEPGDYRTMAEGGLTARQHAAISLCVPDSGCDWLDAMIQMRRRDEMAGMAMQGVAADSSMNYPTYEAVAKVAYATADAMLAASKKEMP